MGGSVAWGEDEENRKEKMDGKGVGDADPRQRREGSSVSPPSDLTFTCWKNNADV